MVERRAIAFILLHQTHLNNVIYPRRTSLIADQRRRLANMSSHNEGRQRTSSTATTVSSSFSDITELKRSLRKDIRMKLSALSPDALQEQSQMVWNRLFELNIYKEAQNIGVFLSMPKGEIMTQTLVQDAVAKNKKIFIPKVGKNFEQCDMDLVQVATEVSSDQSSRTMSFYESWPRNKWGIPEPDPKSFLQAAVPGDLDLIIVPGLAFDSLGNRLGQGKGYYDRFIARMKVPDVKHPCLVGVGLHCQLLNDGVNIPVNDLDQRLDMVIIPHQTIIIEK